MKWPTGSDLPLPIFTSAFVAGLWMPYPLALRPMSRLLNHVRSDQLSRVWIAPLVSDHKTISAPGPGNDTRI
jgi:hypothetical protein